VTAATLDAGGRIICVLCDSLEKTVSSKRFRDALHSGRATLVTPFTPDIRFAVANAMRANRYQYALSDAAIVVETRQSGGIWSGADENRKHRWVPAFVRTGSNVSSGNHALLHLGLHPLTHAEVENCASLTNLLVERAANPPPPVAGPRPRPDLYSLFLAELAALDEATASCEQAVAAHFGIEPEQARVWLARARAEMEQAAPKSRDASRRQPGRVTRGPQGAAAFRRWPSSNCTSGPSRSRRGSRGTWCFASAFAWFQLPEATAPARAAMM
jgi:predicted Rossmann fold nucleotide-binding protein DprA/Smf involved in DNA uptake